ncbi:hypothetical protein [Massilia yuzhufengensis]|uniref:Lipoprotein n=1 Tax=Massilia yuzhufengensis TaxID=1164594 RepID=A0A1I1ICV2_9BURK|nr:hypothetical protein [Massilia yuzhufengensis]SFC32038.1 hypothetical protein SAMN05216204_105112 [Massilia yuzhufengensis]
MYTRAAFRPSLPLLALFLAAALALGGCKRAEREPAKPAPAAVKETPVRTKEQAMTALLAVPELKAWSEQIEKRSKGKAHGAVIEDDPTPRDVNGKKYYQLTFVENRANDVRRRESFLVAQQGDEILVDDTETDTLMSLQEWRRNIHRVELKSAD